jgi:hypothetical protein
VLIFGYLLLVLIPVGAIAVIIWNHKRRASALDRASAGRMTELLGVAEAVRRAPEPELRREGSGRSDVAPGAPVPAAGGMSAAAPDVPTELAAPLYKPRDRVLTAPQTLLYYLLKTGLPDHVVFPRVPLSALIEAGPGLSGFARDEQVRRLCAINVDFLVADKSMRPVTVVELSALIEGGAAQADRESARERLAAAGVRYLEINPRSMPRKEAVRALVLGRDTAEAPQSPVAEAAS